jgi:hypothetical protein
MKNRFEVKLWLINYKNITRMGCYKNKPTPLKIC